MDDSKKATKSKITSGKDAAAWLLGKLNEKVPLHQARGPFTKGPRAYIPCRPCTRLFADKKRPDLVVGIPKQRARSHARAHKLGQIRAPRAN